MFLDRDGVIIENLDHFREPNQGLLQDDQTRRSPIDLSNATLTAGTDHACDKIASEHLISDLFPDRSLWAMADRKFRFNRASYWRR
ncbi:MAG: hypothetical protein ACKO8I_05705 [Cyanobacteriota bacterium]